MFFGGPVVTNARAFYTTRAAAGALSARHFLRPLAFWAEFSCKTRTQRVARMWSYVFRHSAACSGANPEMTKKATSVYSAAAPRTGIICRSRAYRTSAT